MAATQVEAPTTSAQPGPRLSDPVIDVASVRSICPYLNTANAGWRRAIASRDHRCGAVDPPAQLTFEKQRGLCLLSEHERCATFVAATALRGSLAAGSSGSPTAVHPPSAGASLWQPTRTSAVVLDRGGRSLRAMPRVGRVGNELVIGILMVASLAAIAVAKVVAPPGQAPQPSASPSLAAIAPAPSVVVVAPTATPSASASSSPAPSTRATSYRVKRGDTVAAIAKRFGITAKALSDANRITASTRLRIGRVLKIPPA